MRGMVLITKVIYENFMVSYQDYLKIHKGIWYLRFFLDSFDNT